MELDSCTLHITICIFNSWAMLSKNTMSGHSIFAWTCRILFAYTIKNHIIGENLSATGSVCRFNPIGQLTFALTRHESHIPFSSSSHRLNCVRCLFANNTCTNTVHMKTAPAAIGCRLMIVRRAIPTKGYTTHTVSNTGYGAISWAHHDRTPSYYDGLQSINKSICDYMRFGSLKARTVCEQMEQISRGFSHNVTLSGCCDAERVFSTRSSGMDWCCQ